eukprot:4654103-Alexandrium_andersonii.AAC.1
MSASLVGSEMCIRDSTRGSPELSAALRSSLEICRAPRSSPELPGFSPGPCLLYTSDAADDM